ncbi:hypothetical protein F1748_11140 [Escherichia coli]|nr:hypothetical protein F1748_11140 [Escherichia coli]
MAPDDKHDLISGTCSHLPLYRCGFKNLLFKKLIVHIVTSQYKQWREHRYLSLLAVLCMESVIG